MRQTIAFIPGSFSVPHSGHWNMISYYAEKADYVIVLVSAPKKAVRRVRDGSVKLSPEKSKAILDVFLARSGLKNVKVLVSGQPSPVRDALKMISGLTGCRVIIGQSDKDVKRYGWVPGCFQDRDDLSFADLVYHAADSVSASDIRKDISDFRKYETVLPDFLSDSDTAAIRSVLYAELDESVQIRAKRNLRGYEDAVYTAPGESPETFNGKPLSANVSPNGSPAKVKFYTDGQPKTEYILCPSGEARRIKGDQGRGDHGLHPWRDLMLFTADAQDFSDAVQDYSPNVPGWKPGMPQSRSVYTLPGGWYALAYTADGKRWYTYEGLPSGLETQQQTKQKWKCEKTPKIGLNTIDFRFKRLPSGGLSIVSAHHGHKVCHIEK